MGMTKKINIFNQEEREIRCIAREHDYLGTGEMIVEEDLEVGRIYTCIRCQSKCYGDMVFLKEISSRWGFQAYLFEELKPHNEEIYIQNCKRRFLEMLGHHNTDENKRPHTISMEEMHATLEKMKRSDPYRPLFTEGHDPGAAYWVYPVSVTDADRIEDSNIHEYRDHEISIPASHFDPLLTVFFTDGIDPELPLNAHRYSTDDMIEGRPVYGFEWYLHPNFYTYENINQMLGRMRETAGVLREGHLEALPGRLKWRLRKVFALVAENNTDQTYRDGMNLTADFYETLADRLMRMMQDCRETDILCVMAP